MKKFTSKHNGEIELRRDKDGYMIVVDNFVQSGPNMEAVWTDTFEKLLPNIKVSSVLVLGFGAGSVVRPIRNKWPGSLISGIEIDPVIIKIAQDYFPENIERVDISNCDAVKYIDKNRNMKRPYDLIIVDCYIGGMVPEKIKTIKFLVNLKQIGKHILLNQLFLSKNKDEMQKIKFLKELDRLYPVTALKLPNNIVITY